MSYKRLKWANEPEPEMAFLNKDAFVAASQRLQAKHFEAPMEEVRNAHKSWYKLLLHSAFRTIMLPCSKRLKARIKSFICEPTSILDVAAGDDTLILDLASQWAPDLCVANDICWRQMGTLRAEAKRKALNILFTNHNAAELPFKGPFSVAILKNTLHHIRNQQELVATLGLLGRISKQILIVEIEDPRRAAVHRIIHWYYDNWLGDGAKNHLFFTRDEFRRLVKLLFADSWKVEIDQVKTLKGRYLIASLTRP